MPALLNFSHFVSTWGYAAIFILSVLQSCCIPTSSEVTLGYAGYLAATGKFNLALVIIVGTLGETVGAFIAYYIGKTLGRGFVDRYGKYVLLTHADLDRAERWYARHETWGVFGTRLIPFVRNFAALPAGVAEAPIVRFGILTFLGSAVWLSAMAVIGYSLAGQWNSIMHGFSDAGYVLAGLAVILLGFLIYHRFRSYRRHTDAELAKGPSERRSAPGNRSTTGAAGEPPVGESVGEPGAPLP